MGEHDDRAAEGRTGWPEMVRCEFREATVNLVRSVVDQNVGKVKTEASRKPIPIDPYVAGDVLAWYQTTKYGKPDDYVFATDAACAGNRRGKQPLWLAKVMQYHIQPAAKRASIAKRIGWHTFRHYSESRTITW